VLALSTASSVASVGHAAAPIEFEVTKIFIEFNATAKDVGIQLMLDGEGWEHASLFGPNDGDKLMDLTAHGSVGKLGVTELFFEGEEPSLAELPLKDFLALFPEGEYRVVGRTVDGQEIVGASELSHEIPPAPDVVTPREGAVTNPDDTVIDWSPVDEPAGIEIAGYQATVELEEPLRVFSVDLPADVTKVTVPAEFLMAGMEYKLEVLAIADNGNQTITEATFSTAS
jgi:hypothetical protein